MVGPQPLKPTGHRRLGEGLEGIEDHRKAAAMPERDANANKSFFGPAGTLKAARGVGRQGSDLNGRVGSQHSRDLQKSRKRK